MAQSVMRKIEELSEERERLLPRRVRTTQTPPTAGVSPR